LIGLGFDSGGNGAISVEVSIEETVGDVSGKVVDSVTG
jgi:hypothetical protein